MVLVKARIGRKLVPILTATSRFVILHGGRGSGKSWAVAIKLVLKAAKSRRLILCAREVMVSIEDSVHGLLVDTIERLGLTDEFEILSSEIRHKITGSRFIYAGIRTHPRKVKGLEGVTDVWVEEAEAVSEDSWQILLPTIGRTVS